MPLAPMATRRATTQACRPSAPATASAQTPFTAAMANLGNPDVSGITGAKAEGAAESDAAIAAQIVASARIGR